MKKAQKIRNGNLRAFFSNCRESLVGVKKKKHDFFSLMASLKKSFFTPSLIFCDSWQVGNWVSYFPKDLDEEWTEWEEKEKIKLMENV